jgi:hypothetical protein
MLAQLLPRATSTAPRLRTTVLSGEEWLATWQELPARQREIYYHPQFVSTCARWEAARPECLLIEYSRGRRLLYPYLRHSILGYESVAGPCCDVQTPYGYGGPLFIGDWDLDAQRRALDAVADHLRHSGAVAEFIRCHPHLTDLSGLRRCGYRTPLVRTNVECPFPGDVRTIADAWESSARRNLGTARRAGLRKRISSDPADLRHFEALYRLTADRLDMAPSYRFDHDYFQSLFFLGAKHVRLIVIETPDANTRPIAAAVIFLGGTLAHYHLGASNFAFQHLRPNDLLYLAMAEEAWAAGCERIVWGGGLSNDPADTLFRFKSQHGPLRTPVHIACRILDEDRYDAVCDEWSRRHPDKADVTKLFLKYRA